jgi:hypothetical protein
MHNDMALGKLPEFGPSIATAKPWMTACLAINQGMFGPILSGVYYILLYGTLDQW